jgi:methyl-accepting chemotaxis protein
MILSRVSVQGKLLLSGLAFTIPIAVMGFFIVSGTQYDIEFNTKELRGTAYMAPLVDLVVDLPVYGRNLASGSPVQVVADRIDASFETLLRMQADYGLMLDVTPEGLGLRGRERLDPDLLRQDWQEAFQAGTAGLDRIEQLIRDLRELVVHIGDTSNLILDPDLDSYYLMDVSLLALPDAIMRLQAELDRVAAQISPAGQISIAGQASLADPASSADQEAGRLFLTIFQTFDLARIEASSRTALQEDANFLGLSPSFQELLPTELDSFLAVSRRIAAPTEDVGTYQILLENALAVSADYWDSVTTELAILLETRIGDYQDSLWMSLAAVAVAVILAYLVVITVARNILGQIKELRSRVSSMAAKDLRTSLASTSRDELGQTAGDLLGLANELNQSIGKFRTLVRTLDSSSGAMASSSGTIKDGSERLKDAVQQIAAAIEESATAMGSIKDTVSRQFEGISRTAGTLDSSIEGLEKIVRTMDGLKELTGQANQAGTEGINSAALLTEAAGQLSTHSRQLEKRIGAIREASEAIGGIVAVIEDVAGRTSLLAMNASIEAAHAGAAGKGFAVVAQAIRELANSTSSALLSIREQTKTIHEAMTAAQEASTGMDTLAKEAGQRIEGTSVQIQTIGQAIERIGQEVEESARELGHYERLMAESRQDATALRDFSESIRRAVEEQDIGSRDIMDAVQELRLTSSGNAETASQLLSMAESLKGESRALDQVVETFQLDEKA